MFFVYTIIIMKVLLVHLNAYGGDGCHLRVVPPGQLLRRPSIPKPFIEPGFSIFLT